MFVSGGWVFGVRSGVLWLGRWVDKSFCSWRVFYG